jgi:Tfp pilus assembly protein PilF
VTRLQRGRGVFDRGLVDVGIHEQEGVWSVRLVWCVVLALTLTGCAARRHGGDAVVPGPGVEPRSTSALDQTSHEPLETLSEQIRRAREARPDRPPETTIENQDPRLAAALLEATARPGLEAYLAVAREYARLKVADRAHDYLRMALAIDRQSAATYDALARLWRDAGAPDVALGDAYRAVHYAPTSPEVRNTLGTVLQAMGLKEAARKQYERALELDPEASYALNNLCYGWILEGDALKAATACERALSVDPDLAAARNNLGILRAAGGDFNGARLAFGRSGDPSAVSYNIGIVHLARGEYREAAESFAAAQQARPTRQTAARMRQALRLSTAGGDE